MSFPIGRRVPHIQSLAKELSNPIQYIYIKILSHFRFRSAQILYIFVLLSLQDKMEIKKNINKSGK